MFEVPTSRTPVNQHKEGATEIMCPVHCLYRHSISSIQVVLWNIPFKGTMTLYSDDQWGILLINILSLYYTYPNFIKMFCFAGSSIYVNLLIYILDFVAF